MVKARRFLSRSTAPKSSLRSWLVDTGWSLSMVAVCVVANVAMSIVFGAEKEQTASETKVGHMPATSKPKPQAGDICTSCSKFWNAQNLPVKYLVHVFDEDGNAILTEVKKDEIIVCPHCDGQLILNLTKGV